MNSDVKKLTYAEKVRLLMAENYWGNNSLGGKIYSFVVADGPLGLRRAKDLRDGGGRGCYPSRPRHKYQAHPRRGKEF